MKYVLALFLFTATVQANAQCKYVKNEVDRFTKSKVVVTKANVSLYGAMIDKWHFRSVDGSYFIDIHSSVRQSFDAIPADGELMFLLDNDSTVQAYSTGLFIPITQRAGNAIVQILDATYALDHVALEQLVSHKVVAIRFYHTNTYTELEMKAAKQQKIMAAAKCLLEAQ